ncbi:MAG TPA: class I SAM-dependent methyltransferase [Acidimicrobiales bacterium]
MNIGGSPDMVLERIGRLGPRPLGEVLDLALYHPNGGFYETGGAAGRRGGDFLTSPEVGPLFGVVLARALDGWWRSMGEPDPFLVVEAGAGQGTLAQTIRSAAPKCSEALRYVLVERSAAQRARHAERLPLEHPSLVLPPVDPDTEQPVPEAQRGPLFTSLAELPRAPGVPAVVLANELLDNLPFDLAEKTDHNWQEVRVGAEEGSLVEVLVPLDEPRSGLLDRLAPSALPGARVPLQQCAGAWLQDALSTAGPKGRVVVIDYATTTADLAQRPQVEWLRTYRDHARGGDHLEALGTQDITCEVAVDQLATIRPPKSNQSQQDWLESWGIEDLVAEGQRIWTAQASNPNVAALAARSRTPEAAALTDPKGLGAFRVLEWHSRN